MIIDGITNNTGDGLLDGIIESNDLGTITGTWTPTITPNNNCTAAVMTIANYAKIGSIVHLDMLLVADITVDNTYTDIKFTLPFPQANPTGTAVGSVYYPRSGNAGVGLIVDWTDGSANEYGFILPSIAVGTSAGNDVNLRASLTYIAA